jgi:hypothetical protein
LGSLAHGSVDAQVRLAVNVRRRHICALKYAPQAVPEVQFSELGRQDHETVSRSTYGTWWMQAERNGSKTLSLTVGGSDLPAPGSCGICYERLRGGDWVEDMSGQATFEAVAVDLLADRGDLIEAVTELRWLEWRPPGIRRRRRRLPAALDATPLPRRCRSVSSHRPPRAGRRACCGRREDKR